MYSNFLKSAYKIATASPDPSNQNGALLLQEPRRSVIAVACNHIPVGVTIDLANRDEKLKYIAHAEEAVILQAAREGLVTALAPSHASTRGLTMVCPWAACLTCARLIIQAGITRLVVHRPRMETTPERWRGSVDEALAWLGRAGVDVVWHNDPIPDAPMIRVNGELWQP